MAIVAADIKFKYAVKTGSAGNSTAGTAGGSLGKWISTTAVSAGLHTLFPKITGAQNAGGQVDYLCVFVHNSHASITLTDAVVWFDGGDPAGGANVAVAVDSTAASLIGASSAQALEASTTTAPGASITGLTYATPASAATGVSLGDIQAGKCRAVWIRRTATNSVAVAGEQIKLAVTGGTVA